MNHAKTLQDVSNNIRTVLGLEFQYEVPLYQRRYVWDEANWEKLWLDILNQEGLAINTSGHFTGPIVTLPIKGKQNKFEVIDGQQRLTTFQVIFCVIRDLWSTDDGLVEIAGRNVKYGEMHKFVPTIYDKPTFKKVVEGNYGKAISEVGAFNKVEGCLVPSKVEVARSRVFGETRISHNILEAYDYFYQRIRNHLNGNREKAVLLNNTIESSFKLIHLTLGTPEQAERIFESINATGRMLSDFDYLRNNLFLRARELGENSKGELYRDEYYNSYWKFENTSNYWDVSKLKRFFETFLMAVWNPYCLEKENVKPFEEYRAYSKSLVNQFSGDQDRIRYEFCQLSSYAKSYKKLIEADSISEIGEHRQFYKDLGIFYKDLGIYFLDSFLLFVKHNYHCELTGPKGVCAILESYIVRRMFVESSTKDSHTEIIENSYTCINNFLLETIKGAPFSANAFAACLKDTWHEDSKVIDAFQNADSKDPKLIRYIFHRMENWRKESANLYEGSSSNWKEEWKFSGKIQGILQKINEDHAELEKFIHLFNDLWPFPGFFNVNSA